MAQPELFDRIRHILETIDMIEQRATGLDPEAFRADRFLQFGIERCLEVISEASRHIPDDLKSLHPDIPWRQVADIGNRIRHAYHAIDSQVIWDVVAHDLAPLRSAIEAMRDSLSG